VTDPDPQETALTVVAGITLAALPGSTPEATAAVVAALGDDFEDEITRGGITLNRHLAQAGTAGILGWLERTGVFDGYLRAWLERGTGTFAWPAGTRAAANALLVAHRELTTAAVGDLLRRAGLTATAQEAP
jgi:hypothetical protein